MQVANSFIKLFSIIHHQFHNDIIAYLLEWMLRRKHQEMKGGEILSLAEDEENSSCCCGRLVSGPFLLSADFHGSSGSLSIPTSRTQHRAFRAPSGNQPKYPYVDEPTLSSYLYKRLKELNLVS